MNMVLSDLMVLKEPLALKARKEPPEDLVRPAKKALTVQMVKQVTKDLWVPLVSMELLVKSV